MADQKKLIELRFYKKVIAAKSLSARLRKLEPDGPIDFRRAGGDVMCPGCNLTYSSHPGYPDFPTFHVLCDGSVVKL